MLIRRVLNYFEINFKFREFNANKQVPVLQVPKKHVVFLMHEFGLLCAWIFAIRYRKSRLKLLLLGT